MLDSAGDTCMHFRLNLIYSLLLFTEVIIVVVAVIVVLLLLYSHGLQLCSCRDCK